ncbi:galactarate dehydratase [Sesbania bispinosa]|nr:galactarate dehydratase [Sesbania bispinosa]
MALETSTAIVGNNGSELTAGQGVPARTPTLNIRYQSGRVTVCNVESVPGSLKYSVFIGYFRREYPLGGYNGSRCFRRDAPLEKVASRAKHYLGSV